MNVTPQALAVQVGQLQARACRFASACETLDVNVRVRLPQVLLALYVHGRRFAACRFASACEIFEVNVTPQALADQVGQRNSRAWRFASAWETFDVNVRAPLPHGFVAVYSRGGGGGGGISAGAASTLQLPGKASVGRGALTPDIRATWERKSARNAPTDDPRQRATSSEARAVTAAAPGTGFSGVASARRTSDSTSSSVRLDRYAPHSEPCGFCQPLP